LFLIPGHWPLITNRRLLVFLPVIFLYFYQILSYFKNQNPFLQGDSLMITIIAKILKALNSETDPAQIGLAVSFSLIAGLTPTLSLHNLVVFFWCLS